MSQIAIGTETAPLRSYMDDVTGLLPTAPCKARVLKRIDELMSWAWMKIKHAKSQSLLVRIGVRNDNTIFVVGGEKIPLLAEQFIKSLGIQYMAELSVKHQGKSVLKQLSDSLARIDKASFQESTRCGATTPH